MSASGSRRTMSTPRSTPTSGSSMHSSNGRDPTSGPEPPATSCGSHRPPPARHAHGSPDMHSGSTRGFRRTSSADGAHAATPARHDARPRAGCVGWRPRTTLSRPFASRRSSPSRRPTVRRSSTASPRTGRSTSRSCTRQERSRAGRGVSSQTITPSSSAAFGSPARSGFFITTTPSPRVSCGRSPRSGPRWSSSRAGAPSPPRLRSRGAA